MFVAEGRLPWVAAIMARVTAAAIAAGAKPFAQKLVAPPQQ